MIILFLLAFIILALTMQKKRKFMNTALITIHLYVFLFKIYHHLILAICFAS